MTRMRPLPVKSWPPEMHDALEAMTPAGHEQSLTGDNRRQGANILGALAHHPALAKAFFTLNGHLLRATSLHPRQRELVIMRMAVLRQCSYEWAQHVFLARDAGLTDVEIAWIAWGPDAPFWDGRDASVLRAVGELDRGGVITDETWAALVEHLDAQQILDIIFTAGAYATIAWMVQSLGIELDDDLRESLTG
ncbi:carboxymuconolactone decarboxylase family protein [Mycobacterium sp.]|uniref:carboxymuconolactone decarboxylase family protein n=1 Tax=Mycobacterium sp. TaxID=1785 RepID=UPI002C7179DE|nr:carboxymuconolactone decarboxylase family protein [Mycobacterium sp.]HTQ18682.1 carboxymuconolactone decarboxylase family protein [Mycobacterium sp.]